MSQTKNSTPTDSPTPEGLELRGNISFGRLGHRGGGDEGHPGILARRAGHAIYCGAIVGTAYAISPGESQYGLYQRILGEFFCLRFDGGEIAATEIFLPGIAERFVEAGLKTGRPVPVRFDGYCVPDAKQPRGYRYQTFVRQPKGQLSHAKRMAIEAGIIAAPAGYVSELTLPVELHGPAPVAERHEEARVKKEGLDELFDAAE